MITNYWIELKNNLYDIDKNLFNKIRNIKCEIDFKFNRGIVKYYLINCGKIELIFKYFCDTSNEFKYAHITENIDILDSNIIDICIFIRDNKIKYLLDK
jgi:hypothetical protein